MLYIYIYMLYYVILYFIHSYIPMCWVGEYKFFGCSFSFSSNEAPAVATQRPSGHGADDQTVHTQGAHHGRVPQRSKIGRTGGWLRTKSCTTKTGWWFGTFFIFPYIGNAHPNWLIFFQRGANHQSEKDGWKLLKVMGCLWPQLVI